MSTAFSSTLGFERRHNRSSDALIALSRLLQSARESSGLPVIAVADPAGFLVAGAGAFVDCERLAAYAPLLDAMPANDYTTVADLGEFDDELSRLGAESEVFRVSFDGLTVLVCGQGDRSRCESALADVAAGCQRILGSRRYAG